MVPPTCGWWNHESRFLSNCLAGITCQSVFQESAPMICSTSVSNARLHLVVVCSLATAGAVSLSGCGGRSDLPELGDVQGVVTLDGQPLSGAQVQFVPQADGRPSVAETGWRRRLPASAHRRPLRCDRGHPQGNDQHRGGWAYDPSTEKIPARYNAQTELTADVQPGSNDINFDLQSK